MIACVISIATILLIVIIIQCAIKGLNKREESDELEAEYLQAKEDSDDYCAALTERFVNSPLTYEILEAIGEGSDRKPEEIIIKQDGVSGRVGGVMRTYDFLTKRVPKLFGKEFSYRYRRCDWGGEEICMESVYIYEQEVLATVFNGILGGEYSIEHKDDGRIVVMRLKPTKHF